MSYLSNIIHAYENGEADWHCTKDALDSLGYFDTVLMIGPCPLKERIAYREIENEDAA